MRRRSFLKKTAAAGLVTWITPSALVTLLKAETPARRGPHFKDPGREYAPYTWWHWMNGNISKKGITLDLEAMSDLGLGGFQMFEVGSGIPKGPVPYLSEAWLDLLAHAVKECKRLDLEFAMHNCPGWSSSGGPWITPELGMQQLTWSETTVRGGRRFDGVLPEPPKRLDYYRDSITIAFPAPKGEDTAWAGQLKDMRANGQFVDLSLMSANGQFSSPLSLGKPDSDNVIDFSFKEDYTLRSLTMLSSGNGRLTLLCAGKGEEFKEVRVLSGENPGNADAYPGYSTANFEGIRSSRYRLAFKGILKISALSLSGTERVDNWLSKANFPGSKAMPGSSLTRHSDGEAIQSSSVIDLTAMLGADGSLDWEVPPGQWTILRMGHTAIGRMNKSAPSTGTGLDCDKFSKAAFDFHWEQVFKNILPLLKSTAGGMVGFLIDSYEMGLQNWSASFPEEFEQREHYSLTSYLPALTGRVVDDLDMTERFLRDFRRAQAEVMADHYYGRFAEHCRENGIVSYTEPYEGGNFEEMKTGRAVDISMGEFWAGHTMLYNNSILDRTIKVAASIAHSKGQSIVGAEAFTSEPGSGKWQQYPFGMKSLVDLMYTRGLTRIIFHRYAHQPHPTALPGMTMGPWGIHFDRTNTWFRKAGEWIRYLTKCQYMLRKGVFVADIAYYIGETVPGKTIDPQKTKWAAPVGYDYDLINSDCLLNECHMKNGRLENQHGVSYQILVLPDIRILSLKVLRKLEAWVDQGLILVGEKPEQSFGVADRLTEKEFGPRADRLWGNDPGSGAAHERVLGHSDLKTILLKFGAEPDFEYTAEATDPAINFIHRREKDGDIYFVANRRRRRENIVCSFRIQDQYPELWDPLTGSTTPMAFYTSLNNRISIPLLLEPSGSVFVVFTQKKRILSYQSLYRNGKPVIPTNMTTPRPRGLHASTCENFTLSCWIKPEIDITLTEEGFYGDRRTDHYAVYPVAGERYYGKGHAGSGFTAGRNGVALFERSADFIKAVLFAEAAISGWSRLTIVYEKNIPHVYVNNTLIKTGRSFGRTVHPSTGESYQDDQASYYNGELCGLELIGRAVRPEAVERMSLILPPPDFTCTASLAAAGEKLCLWKNGFYTLTNARGEAERFPVTQLTEPKPIKGDWLVRFPERSGAPDSIKMTELAPLQKHDHQGVKYFSGTAEYLVDFTFEVPDFDHQVMLDLGRVEVLAEVKLNGTVFPVLWAQPYRLDIASAVRHGSNTLSIKVTTLWPNRLIGDEQLPEENEYTSPASSGKLAIGGAGGIKKLPEWYVNGADKPAGGRITFSTWKHYHKDSPLLESGLVGPVSIQIGFLKALLK